MGVTVATKVDYAQTSGTPDYTQDITTAKLGGLTPKAAIVCISKRDNAEGNEVDAGIGLGFTDGTRKGAFSDYREDNVSTSDTDGEYSTSRIIYFTDEDASIIAEADCSLITNGIRLTWKSNPSDDYRISVVFFAGTDVSAHCGELDLGDSSSPVSTTAPGFKPDVIFGFHNRDEYVSASSNFGIARRINDSSATNGAIIGRSRNNQSNSLVQGGIRNDGIVHLGSDGNIQQAWAVTGFSANGFTVTEVEGGSDWSGFRGYFLSLKFDNASTYLAWETAATSTGNDDHTSPGFDPQAIMGFYMLADVDPSTYNNNNSRYPAGLGFFAADDTDEFSTSICDEKGQSTTDTQSNAYDNLQIWRDNGFVRNIADTSMITNGWRWNWTTANDAYRILTLAIEEYIQTVKPWWYYQRNHMRRSN